MLSRTHRISTLQLYTITQPMSKCWQPQAPLTYTCLLSAIYPKHRFRHYQRSWPNGLTLCYGFLIQNNLLHAYATG